jgi:hypothetical protein
MGTLPLLGSGLAIDSVNPVWQGSNQELVVMVISICLCVLSCQLCHGSVVHACGSHSQ